MKIFDISRELMSAPVYDGDIAPSLEVFESIENGDICNISNITMCLHNGTHIDAPKHFLNQRHDISELGTNAFCGICDVVSFDEHITADHIAEKVPQDCERLLIKSFGKARLTVYSLMDIKASNIKLIGIDDISIGMPNADALIHKELLGSDIIILEGLDLSAVPDGRYVLVCAPIKIKGAEAAPCRAILLKDIMLY